MKRTEPRLTATEARILTKARASGRIDVTCGHKGKRTYGTRDKSAAQHLVALGLLIHNGSRSYADAKWGGQTDYSTTTIYLPATKDA